MKTSEHQASKCAGRRGGVGVKIGSQVTGHLTNREVGRVEFTGTVSDSFESNGQAMVAVACGDGVERFALAENVVPTEPNLMTHTGKVHAPGNYYKQLRGRAPKCCASVSAVARFHYVIPTQQAVDCHKCLNLLAKEGLK